METSITSAYSPGEAAVGGVVVGVSAAFGLSVGDLVGVGVGSAAIGGDWSIALGVGVGNDVDGSGVAVRGSDVAVDAGPGSSERTVFEGRAASGLLGVIVSAAIDVLRIRVEVGATVDRGTTSEFVPHPITHTMSQSSKG